MYTDIINNVRPEMEKVMEFFRREMSKIRTGQASPALVEDVTVDLFGSKMPIKQVAGISVPERNQIVIQPWDASYIEPIEKALHQTSIGASPVVDKNVIRITLPQLTEEFRTQLVKTVGEKAEEAREGIRRVRDEAWSEIQAAERRGDIPEDDKFKGKEELQKLVDEFNRSIEESVEKKKQEISQ